MLWEVFLEGDREQMETQKGMFPLAIDLLLP